jgi:hypothetical protein
VDKFLGRNIPHYLEFGIIVPYICYNKVIKHGNMAKFKQEVLDKIRDDADLFAAVAKELKIRPVSLPQTLLRNGASLNQYSVITLVADYLDKKPADLLEEDTADEAVNK